MLHFKSIWLMRIDLQLHVQTVQPYVRSLTKARQVDGWVDG